ncbi:hypothetical protein MMC10_000372 [Thelotrema lepadinum]|nr:hypothetical protein [Thelotrema lepadinum]
MAPADDTTSRPLADWFFISGLDSEQLDWSEIEEEDTGRVQNDSTSNGRAQIDATIAEDSGEEGEDGTLLSPSHRTSKRLSFQRLSHLSDGKRSSYISTKSSEGRGTDSNRSSTTIKAVQVNNTRSLNDYDFEKALRKFASERDSFLLDLSASAGAVVKQPKPRPKTQRIVNDDPPGLKSGLGSVRRRISFREMSSMKRQPSVARQASVRTSRRMSNYNSVINNPQPLKPDANMHPLKKKFAPVLLDRYPQKAMVEELKRRGPFPDFVPMFTFPNDINVVSSDERPRATWHGFAMTSGDNSRLYGICITIWIPLNEDISIALEKKCELWRKRNMSDEERELAISLGERLVADRAKLSRLLARLPSVTSGSVERDALEEEIGAVEEKIALMTDLLRPVRHGAASKIEGLTDGESGFWIPRAFGILGRDPALTSFWKEWLKAIAVPMASGGILRVPPTSPRVGMWQPLERYVVNLCAEALSPISSKTQVEVAIRDLKLFARKEAANELPGSRNTDLYALFKALDIPRIMILFEFVLAESRIILLSSHTAMLHLVSRAIVELLYPFTWSGVFIPVLPARLIETLEAPCPYIIGIERRYDKIELPTDDFVLVDLDQNEIESSMGPPVPLPKQQRRKLQSLLQQAAPHQNRYGVQPGPPAYAIEAFPWSAFSSENTSVFTAQAPPTTLSKYAGLNSASFGSGGSDYAKRLPIFNAFLRARESRGSERPQTSSTRDSPPPTSPAQSQFGPQASLPRNDSGFSLQATLREKRSGHFDNLSRRSSSFNMERRPTIRRPSAPFTGSGHSTSPSVSTISTDSLGSNYAQSIFAPSTYAQSTLAASTIMPQVLYQPVQNRDGTTWIEGHCLVRRPRDENVTCSVCDERIEDDSATGESKKSGMLFKFNHDGFRRSMPHENAEYVAMLQQTQAFHEFIHEREIKLVNDPSIMLFDQIILAKRNRGKHSIFGKSKTDFLSDTSDHLWRSAAANPPNGRIPGDYMATISRVPAKLDPTLMKEPRVIQGVPRLNTAKARRKPIPSLLGPNGLLASSPPSA